MIQLASILIKVYTFIDKRIIKVYTYIQVNKQTKEEKMTEKTTLTKEAEILYKAIIDACNKNFADTECYERLLKIKEKARNRYHRRYTETDKTGKEVITNKVSAGRPKKENKKKQLGIKLPPYLIEWLNRQPESNAKLIETALVSHYQIPEGIQTQ